MAHTVIQADTARLTADAARPDIKAPVRPDAASNANDAAIDVHNVGTSARSGLVGNSAIPTTTPRVGSTSGALMSMLMRRIVTALAPRHAMPVGLVLRPPRQGPDLPELQRHEPPRRARTAEGGPPATAHRRQSADPAAARSVRPCRPALWRGVWYKRRRHPELAHQSYLTEGKTAQASIANVPTHPGKSQNVSRLASRKMFPASCKESVSTQYTTAVPDKRCTQAATSTRPRLWLSETERQDSCGLRAWSRSRVARRYRAALRLAGSQRC